MIAAERCVGQSRVELYLSLSVFPIDIPPLRDRVDDIAPLVRLILLGDHPKAASDDHLKSGQ